ncbi:MAG: Water Stress and Hypersensitive response domain protein [Proteobacteria bacterium]|nr:Water Stress and Hypersensitive response domain protein [Pseudomonadota bacterium]MBS1173690.1 Water Stress and Hypersensitive response domain protein [Pseudomonadota bacterium]
MNRSVTAVLAAALLWGCAALTTQPPEVTLAGIDIVEMGLLEQRFAMKLRLQNPNDAGITITGLSFQVEVNGQTFAKGVSGQSVTVPRFGEAVLAVDAVSNLASVLRQISELSKGGREGVDYRIHGRLATGNFGSVPFESKGELRLPRLPGEPRAAPGGT